MGELTFIPTSFEDLFCSCPKAEFAVFHFHYIAVAEQTDQGIESIWHPRQTELSYAGTSADGRFNTAVAKKETQALSGSIETS